MLEEFISIVQWLELFRFLIFKAHEIVLKFFFFNQSVYEDLYMPSGHLDEIFF